MSTFTLFLKDDITWRSADFGPRNQQICIQPYEVHSSTSFADMTEQLFGQEPKWVRKLYSQPRNVEVLVYYPIVWPNQAKKHESGESKAPPTNPIPRVIRNCTKESLMRQVPQYSVLEFRLRRFARSMPILERCKKWWYERESKILSSYKKLKPETK